MTTLSRFGWRALWFLMALVFFPTLLYGLLDLFFNAAFWSALICFAVCGVSGTVLWLAWNRLELDRDARRDQERTVRHPRTPLPPPG
jgi:hypothetical protein